MEEHLMQLWNGLALILRRILQGVALVLFGTVVFDWSFYALNLTPVLALGWGGLLILVLAVLLYRLKPLAEAVQQHYIGPWQSLYTEAQAEIQQLRASLQQAQQQNTSLSRKLSNLEEYNRQRQADAVIAKLNPTNQTFKEEM